MNETMETHNAQMAGNIQARKSHPSYMYKQGDGYIVVTWDESVKCHRTSYERPYFQARSEVAADNCPGGDKCHHSNKHTQPYNIAS